MPGRPYVLAETYFGDARNAALEVAVLPWGATEAHNYHLPYGTDSLQAEAVAVESARLAGERGAEIMVLPTIPIGVNVQQLDIPLTLNLNPSTQAKVLGDVIGSLENHGVAKFVILNGHGGNDFRQMVRESQAHTDVFLCAVDWYAVLPASDFFDEPGDHAGELETSFMMHLAPDLVLPLDQAGEGRAKVFKVRALREGWAWAPRSWTEVTEDTGVGDPRHASAEKGARFFGAVTQAIAEFFVELAAADPTDLYEDR